MMLTPGWDRADSGTTLTTASGQSMTFASEPVRGVLVVR
jgi:hypothetical protein